MTQIKRLIVIIITVLIVVAAAGVQPARAVTFWTFGDNMETNPQATWSCWHENPSDKNCQFNNNYAAHSGTHFVGISDIYGSWSDVGRPVTVVPNFFAFNITCRATIYVMNGSRMINTTNYVS